MYLSVAPIRSHYHFRCKDKFPVKNDCRFTISNFNQHYVIAFYRILPQTFNVSLQTLGSNDLETVVDLIRWTHIKKTREKGQQSPFCRLSVYQVVQQLWCSSKWEAYCLYTWTKQLRNLTPICIECTRRKWKRHNKTRPVVIGSQSSHALIHAYGLCLHAPKIDCFFFCQQRTDSRN